MNTKDTFAERISLLRNEKGLTQTELATKIGISRQSITLYENHARVPDIEILARFARFFEVTADYLVGLTDNRTSENSAIGKQLGLSDAAIERLYSYEYVNQIFELPLDIYEDRRHRLNMEAVKNDEQLRSEIAKLHEDSDKQVLEVAERIGGENSRIGNSLMQIIGNFRLIEYTINELICDTDLIILLGQYLYGSDSFQFDHEDNKYNHISNEVLDKIFFLDLQEKLFEIRFKQKYDVDKED